MTGIAATLRETEPGIRIRLVLDDGREVAGAFRGVTEGAIDVDNGQRQHVDPRHVKSLLMDFSRAA